MRNNHRDNRDNKLGAKVCALFFSNSQTFATNGQAKCSIQVD